jgi:acetyl esterase/lipase
MFLIRQACSSLLSLSLLYLLTSFSGPRYTPDSPPPIDKKQLFRNIAYGREHNQNMDVVLPRNRSSEKTPLIVFIHGGAWVIGNKNYFRREIKEFADSGFACASINYRFVSNEKKIHHQEITSDVLLALEYLRDHAKSWNISNDRIALVGHSAGGQLAMIIGYTLNKDHIIKTVVSWSGVSDFLDYTKPEGTKKSTVFAIYTGQTLKTTTDTALWKQASPYWNVQRGSIPTLLVQGDQDHIVPAPYAAKMKNKLDTLGVINKLLTLQNCGHIYFGRSWKSAKSTTCAWLKMYL